VTSPNAERLIVAFVEYFGQRDEYVYVRKKGGDPGYVHIVPQGFDPSKAGQRHVTVELFNGSVSVDEPLREALGATARPIDETDPEGKRGFHISDTCPLGASCGTYYGSFRWGLTFQEIEKRGVRAFVEQVAGALSEHLRPAGGQVASDRGPRPSDR